LCPKVIGIARESSQNWRQDNSVNWQLAGDLGYGFGWKLAIGSVAPYYTGWTTMFIPELCTQRASRAVVPFG
jgi:hypothetical protein